MSLALRQSLYSKITGGTAVTNLLASNTAVYPADDVPSGSLFDYVMYGLSAGGPSNDSPHDAENMVYTVQAVSNVSKRRAVAIDDALRALLHRASLTVTGWSHYYLARIAEIEYTEVNAEGMEFYHVGAEYRIRLQKS